MKGMTRLIMVPMLVAGLTVSAEAPALGWEALWWNADQRAARRMQRGEHAESARMFDDERWRAAALYRAGEYHSAAEAWSELDDVQAHYNRGNALARAGDLPAAAEAYETVLDRDPEHADARYNLELIREHMQDGEDDDTSQNESRQQGQREGEQRESTDGDTEQQQDRRQSGRQERDEEGGRPSDDSGAAGSPRSSQAADEGSGNQPRDQQAGQPEQSPAAPTEQDDAAQDGGAAMSTQDEADDPAEQAAMEQWLRRIPDDPGGLLRRKFRYQYQRRERDEDEVREPW